MPVRAHLLLAAALLSGTLLPLAVPAAADTGPVALGLPGFADVVADEAHGQLFLSPGGSGSSVRVTDLQGGAARTVDGLPGATGMALTPDSRSLWVALPVGALARVDTATLAVMQKISMPTGQCPGDVAVVGSRVVYGHSCATYGSGGSYGGIGVVDAATGQAYGGVTSGPSYRPVVATGPAGQVYAADAGSSPTGLHLYDVAGAAPVLVAAVREVCSNLRDLSAAPDGSRVVTACGYPYEHTVWSASKLAKMGTYPSGPYPLAGAWSADGATFVAGIDSAYEPDVYVYRSGLNAPARVVDFGSTSALLQPKGLAVSADGLRVWAVTGDRSSTGLAVRVLDVPSPDAATLTVSASPSAMYAGSSTTVSGRLATLAGAPLAGQVLRVSRGATGTNPAPLPEVTTDADGRFSFADVPPAAGSYVYDVSRASDGARAQVSVLVWSVEGTLTFQLSRGTSGGIPVSGTLQLSYSGPDSPAGQTVSLVREGGGVRVDLPSVVTDAKGVATFTDAAPAGDFTYTATVAPNGIHPAVTATRTTTVLTATKLTATAPESVSAGTPVEVSGVLVEPARPVAGGTVSVLRSGCGTTNWASSVTTSADGRYAVTDGSPPVGSCTYQTSFAGGSGYASSTASATTKVTLVPTAFVTHAPSPTVAGSPVTVSGRLEGGGTGVVGAPVSVLRNGCSSTGWQEATVTAPDGTWSFTDPAAPGGACTYRLSYGGDSTKASAATSVSAAVAFRTPDVTVSVVRGTGSTKKLVTITGQLGPTYKNRTLTITAQPVGAAEAFVASGTVDGAGKLAATYTPKTTTTYRVKFAGDDWYAAAVAERTQ